MLRAALVDNETKWHVCCVIERHAGHQASCAHTLAIMFMIQEHVQKYAKRQLLATLRVQIYMHLMSPGYQVAPRLQQYS
jgi:cytidine deaminase